MDNSLFKIKDLYLAAFLYAEGKELISTEREGSVYWFLFADKESCEELANLYWGNKIAIKAKAFVDSIRTLKDLIFSRK